MSKTISHILAELETKVAIVTVLINTKEDQRGNMDPNAILLEIENLIIEMQDLLGLTAKDDLLKELTGMLDEHPDGWEGDCYCTTCIEAMNCQ